MKAYLATHNAGKLRELAAIFAGSELEIATFDAYDEVVEDAESYAGNAMLKAQALRRQLRNAGIETAVLADDSGLEVDALNARPGIRSARYAGAQIGWPQRRAALLAELHDVPQERRTARFVCVMALLVPERELLTARGEVEGRVLTAERGGGGFGYDPLFFYAPLRRTFAQLSSSEKNAVSHRRRAADALLTTLCERA